LNAFYDLPVRIQQLARRKRDRMIEDPRTVDLKKAAGYWSARVNRQYRAVGIDLPDVYGVLSIWIGKHDQYERLLNG
jgi:plasmid maintenance system killer protein